MHKKPDKFLKLPEYPGGKEQLMLFIKNNLKYPKEAQEKKIEGLVLLSAEITDKGEVLDITVERGIGYGCDEEAIRVLSLMKFGSVKNRGLRVKARKKFKINFSLPKITNTTLTYNLKKNIESKQERPTTNYSYTITINDKT